MTSSRLRHVRSADRYLRRELTRAGLDRSGPGSYHALWVADGMLVADVQPGYGDWPYWNGHYFQP